MLGLAHIGVLQWFEEHHIPVDRLSGTSMGAFVGGLYATGRSPAEMRKLALTTDFLSVVTFETPYTEVGFRRRQDRRGWEISGGRAWIQIRRPPKGQRR